MLTLVDGKGFLSCSKEAVGALSNYWRLAGCVGGLGLSKY